MKEIKSQLLQIACASQITDEELIQSLWSGYGSLMRIHFESSASRNSEPISSLIVKHINFKQVNNHPRGWSTDIGHERKVRSYEVEQAWYHNFANQLPKEVKVPHCYDVIESEGSVYLIMEDLGGSGYPILSGSANPITIRSCIQWLARFHAFHLQVKPDQLWDQGSYWHLNSRPDELAVLYKEDPHLAGVAQEIDTTLRGCKFQTIIHGDAKIANFCFSEEGYKTAAVDFQYVGGGIGMQDLAYFLGSCLSESECAKQEQSLLDLYFAEFKIAALEFKTSERIIAEVEMNWRNLYNYAWADFHRFLKGWSPGHWKINGYSEDICKSIISEIQSK